MKMRTSELQGVALDWAVAQCEGLAVEYLNDGITLCLLQKSSKRYAPSTNWAQGGVIIEREGIATWIRYDGDEGWKALMRAYDEDVSGKTPLIAAMRCYIAEKLGDEVEIPDELKGEK